MELLLNVLWLLLILPIFWVWRREELSSIRLRQPGSLRSLVVLGSALILLFPVISASDDLHVMRPDMEESGSKRVLQAAGDRNHGWAGRAGSNPAVSAFLNWPVAAYFEVCAMSQNLEVSLPKQACIASGSSRAPPLALA